MTGLGVIGGRFVQEGKDGLHRSDGFGVVAFFAVAGSQIIMSIGQVWFKIYGLLEKTDSIVPVFLVKVNSAKSDA